MNHGKSIGGNLKMLFLLVWMILCIKRLTGSMLTTMTFPSRKKRGVDIGYGKTPTFNDLSLLPNIVRQNIFLDLSV